MNEVLKNFKVSKKQMQNLAGGKSFDCFILGMKDDTYIHQKTEVADNVSLDDCKKALQKEYGDDMTVRCY